MNKGRIFDIIILIVFFGIYIIILNVDKNIDNCNFLCRHIWMPLMIAYYIGRFVSYYLYKNNNTDKKQNI